MATVNQQIRIVVLLLAASAAGVLRAQNTAVPQFELVQPELFAASGGQPNCWADVDGDGDLDLFVGFRQGVPNRVYRNDNGTFSDVAAQLGVADLNDTRAASWGDFDGDGDVDLFVGFTRKTEIPSKLYRNEGPGKPFIDVAKAMGIDASGETRQSSFIDFDNDGDLDLFVGLRDAPNMLFRNDGKTFMSVGKEMGIDDPRRTVGAVWFDMDQDGDLDVFVGNQNGDLNGLFRNDGARFVDVAKELGVDAAGRPATSGSNGPSVADYDNDGDLDLFVAGYGGNFLYRNDGPGKFTEVAAEFGVAGRRAGNAVALGRFRQRRPDRSLRVVIHRQSDQRARFPLPQRRRPIHRRDSREHRQARRHARHPVGGLRQGRRPGFLGRQQQPEWHALPLPQSAPAGASASVDSSAGPGRARACDACRRRGTGYAAGTRKLLGAGIVDSGGGYASQNVVPVHVGLGTDAAVDVEVTTMGKGGRKVTKLSKMIPGKIPARVLVVKAG